MKARGPIVTVVAVLGLALVLLVINRSVAGTQPADPAAAAQAAPTVAAAPATIPSTAAVPAATEPAPSPFPAKVKYIGTATTKNGPIPLAVTIDGDRAKAYLCDGKKIEAWLQGTARDGRLSLTGRGENRLTGQRTGDTVTGTVLVAGYPEWTFTARPATGARAGVYRASGAGTTTGWIVQDDSGRAQVGISRDAGGKPAAAPRLDVTTLNADGAPGQPLPVDGDTDVLARS